METDVRGVSNQYWFWYETQRAQYMSCSDFFALMVVFIISTPVDMYGKINVEPVKLIGSWFKCNICTKAQSWCQLGFVSDIKVKSSAQNATGKFAAKDYHPFPKVVVLDIAVVHSADGFDHTLSLSLNGTFFDVRYNVLLLWLLGMLGETILTVHITTPHVQSIFAVNVMSCLRKLIIHMLCAIVSLSKKFRASLSKKIGKKWNAFPSTSLKMHSGIFPLVQIGMVTINTVLQRICIPSKKAYLHISSKDWWSS